MPVGGNSFGSVRKAREAIKAHAEEIYNNYRSLAMTAAADGDYETAEKIWRFLLEHMPDEDGHRLIDISVDKPKTGELHSGPIVNIGFALGGMKPKEQLPEAVIDVTPNEPSKE